VSEPESTVSETVEGLESPANAGVRESRAKPETPGSELAGVEQAGAGRCPSLVGAPARRLR